MYVVSLNDLDGLSGDPSLYPARNSKLVRRASTLVTIVLSF